MATEACWSNLRYVGVKSGLYILQRIIPFEVCAKILECIDGWMDV